SVGLLRRREAGPAGAELVAAGCHLPDGPAVIEPLAAAHPTRDPWRPTPRGMIPGASQLVTVTRSPLPRLRRPDPGRVLGHRDALYREFNPAETTSQPDSPAARPSSRFRPRGTG